MLPYLFQLNSQYCDSDIMQAKFVFIVCISYCVLHVHVQKINSFETRLWADTSTKQLPIFTLPESLLKGGDSAVRWTSFSEIYRPCSRYYWIPMKIKSASQLNHLPWGANLIQVA